MRCKSTVEPGQEGLAAISRINNWGKKRRNVRGGGMDRRSDMAPSAGLIHARGCRAGGKKCALPYTRPYTVPSARLGWEAVLEEMVARHGLPYGRSCCVDRLLCCSVLR